MIRDDGDNGIPWFGTTEFKLEPSLGFVSDGRPTRYFHLIPYHSYLFWRRLFRLTAVNVQIASQPAAVTEGLAVVEMGGAGPDPVCCRSVLGSGPGYRDRTPAQMEVPIPNGHHPPKPRKTDPTYTSNHTVRQITNTQYSRRALVLTQQNTTGRRLHATLNYAANKREYLSNAPGDRRMYRL